MVAQLKSLRGAGLVGVFLCSICLPIVGCSYKDKPPADWQKIDAGAFSLYAPRGWKFHKKQGIDSYVGEIAGGGVVLSFDFGQFSNSLSDAQEPSFVVAHELIHGSEAKIVSPRTPGHGVTAIYFPSVPRFLKADNKLCLVGNDLTAAQQEVALRIFRTIRFKGLGS
jgi:hypothetical protein